MSHIFVTGGTGVLGSALVPLFLADPTTRVTLLIRAESPDQLRLRLAGLLDFWNLPADDHSWRERIEAVAGDVAADQLGMNADQVGELSRTATHIVHAAGNVKLNQTLAEARQTAVNAARSVIRLAEQCRDEGQFQKLEFVSTVGVAGRHTGLMREERMPEEQSPADFHNTYEAAKWEAERLLWSEIDQGLPATIHRPSMIVGDSRTGRIIRFQVFYFLAEYLLGRRSWGIIPRTDETRLDIIPVDYVAQAIHLSAVRSLAVGQVLHLCSGPEQSVSIENLIAQLQTLATQYGQNVPRLRRLSPNTFRRLLVILTRLAPSRSRRALQGLPYLLDYLDEKQVFDNAHAQSILSAAGIHIPPVEEYLEPVMRVFWEDRDSRAAGRR